MRALLIVNPFATSTTPVRREVITHALASELDLDVVETRYRGHAAHVAEGAAREGFGLVLTLGGDGTVNEVVNGMLRARPPDGTAPRAPLLAALPGGNANVFAKALGLPMDPVDATGRVLRSLPAGKARTIGLGLADGGQPGGALRLPGGEPPDPTARNPPVASGPVPPSPGRGRRQPGGALRLPGGEPPDPTARNPPVVSGPVPPSPGRGPARYFCFNAGLGLDAEVVRVVEGLRARGRTASTGLYVWTTLRQFTTVTDRREPALTLECDGMAVTDGLFLGIVSNASPWTYLGRRPVNASPQAGFDTGLDLFALRKLGALGTLNALRQMLGSDGGPAGRNIVRLHDQAALTFRADRPVAFQVDGEYVGEREHVMLRSIPNALRVLV